MAAGSQLLIPLDTIKATALEMASESSTQLEIAESLGIAPRTLARILAEDKQFRDLYDSTLYQASSQLLEKLREIPWDEIDAQRARVKIDALARYLELRWPHRYGKRIDVTVRTIDMRSALERARARRDASVVSVVPAGEAASAACESVALASLLE